MSAPNLFSNQCTQSRCVRFQEAIGPVRDAESPREKAAQGNELFGLQFLIGRMRRLLGFGALAFQLILAHLWVLFGLPSGAIPVQTAVCRIWSIAQPYRDP